MIAAALKKNYKLLRELEVSLDRQQALNKHLGLQKGKLFAAFTRQATVDNLKLSCKFSVMPEALNEDAVKGESAIIGQFSEFARGESGMFHMNRDRFLFVPAASWSSFHASRFVGDNLGLYNMLNYNQFFAIGGEDFRALARGGLFKDSRKVGVLALFPYLACAGWGRANVSVNSVMGRSKEEFVLNIRMENAPEMIGVDQKKNSEARCSMLCGVMAGWCSEALGFKVHCLEVKLGLFVVAAASILDAQAKRVATELKMSSVPKLAPLLFQTETAQAIPSTPDTSKKGRSSIMHKGGLESAALTVNDALDVIGASLLQDVKQPAEKRDRGASFAERLRSVGMKKQQTSGDLQTPSRRTTLTGKGDSPLSVSGGLPKSVSKVKLNTLFFFFFFFFFFFHYILFIRIKIFLFPAPRLLSLNLESFEWEKRVWLRFELQALVFLLSWAFSHSSD